jgi:hypothetical protein
MKPQVLYFTNTDSEKFITEKDSIEDRGALFKYIYIYIYIS